MTTDQGTLTDLAVRPVRGRTRGRSRRRRPVRRGLVVVHRWAALVLGLLLVIEASAGAVLLYNDQYFRATHASFYRHTASAHPLTAQQAPAVVEAAHPGFEPAWVSADDGVLVVGDPAYTTAVAVDPGTGAINGSAALHGGLFGWLANLHECALTCVGYPGYLAALAHPVPTLGLSALTGITWGALLLGVLGLLPVLLAISGIITWWPGLRRLGRGFRVRTGRGRFARDYDLHNLIGGIAVPALLMWGVTGAAFEFPAVSNIWLTITGGHAVSAAHEPTFTAHQAGANRIDITAAVTAARHQVGGDVRYLVLPTPDADYYQVSMATGIQPYGNRAFYGGDVTVYVDANDASHSSVVDAPAQQPTANNFYSRVLEPAHFGWQVNGWWRIVWVLFGLTPLALALTGLSTWLIRRRTRRNRRVAR
ncbi:MAG TPA: PepSY-associated TM helix domain-containing protein [Pseudonocardiaceae bacterium]|jgi:uncharacterized iron-regulated membrane protein|nr:PepSY-associated TM helix domain-containing protein [Pseudonocardiaceae bacterium]